VEAGRTRWTDDRMDDLAVEIRGLRAEMRDGFRDLRSEIGDVRGEIGDVRGELGHVRGELGHVRGELGDLRTDLHADVRSLYGEIGLNRRWLGSMWATMLLGFVGLLVEIALR
jgi:hypothetical protein